MPRVTPWVLNALFALLMGLSTLAHGDDEDALELQSAPAPGPANDSSLRAALELGIGRIEQRSDPRTENANRVSFDVRYAMRLTDAWRLSLSDRLDRTHPAPASQPETSNSLREAYLAWQEPAGATSLDIGRVNLRQGPSYGYNPTDYFRSGALRAIPTADPIALREMRMGTVMLWAGHLWSQGSASLAVAPKLDANPDESPASLDLGATNARNRSLLTGNLRFSERISGQGLLLVGTGQSPTIGASVTALVTDSLVTYAEWSSGRMRSLLDLIQGSPAAAERTQQVSAGLTYTFPGALSVTAEAEYNGAGLDRSGWDAVLSQGAAAYQRYLSITQSSQELGSRRAWLLYATQKNLGIKQLDATAFLRTNAVDHSHLAWVELRYHWPRFDAALQWQQSSGGAGTEFGVLPYRRVIQLLGVFFF